MIGKASVDSLIDLPLVQISYNIERPGNKLTKRLLDLLISSILLISTYPFVYFKRVLAGTSPTTVLLSLPEVFRGRKSLVGPPEQLVPATPRNGRLTPSAHLGKPGLTGLVQLQQDRNLTGEEIEQYNLYYAKNQSLFLDLEILLKSLFRVRAGNPPAVSGPSVNQKRRARVKEVQHG